jgi:hypothetical protein
MMQVSLNNAFSTATFPFLLAVRKLIIQKHSFRGMFFTLTKSPTLNSLPGTSLSFILLSSRTHIHGLLYASERHHVNLLGLNPQHSFFKLQPGKHDYAATPLAFYLYVGTHANYLPGITATGMLLFHADNIAQIEFFAFHSILPLQVN